MRARLAIGPQPREIRLQLPRGRLISHPESGRSLASEPPPDHSAATRWMPMSQSPTPSGSRIVTEEHRAEVLRAMNRSRWRMDGFWEWSKIIIFAVALFIMIRTFGV